MRSPRWRAPAFDRVIAPVALPGCLRETTQLHGRNTFTNPSCRAVAYFTSIIAKHSKTPKSNRPAQRANRGIHGRERDREPYQ